MASQRIEDLIEMIRVLSIKSLSLVLCKDFNILNGKGTRFELNLR